MACIATQYLNKLNEYERSRLQKCSSAAEDIHEQARCLVRAIDAKPKQIDPTRTYNIQKLQKLLDRKQKTVDTLIQSESHYDNVESGIKMKQVEFRTRRSVINRRNYKLHTEYENLTPFGILGKHLSKMTKIVKNKNPNSSWKKMLYDIENIKRQQEKNEQLRKRFSLNQYFGNVEPKLKANEKNLLKELSISDHALQGLGKNNVKTKKTLEIAQLVRRAIKLAMVLSGANSTELENKTLRFGSPRLLSMAPDDAKDQISH
ncbi:ATP-dependent RNA helicase [Dirofilaria immitis]